MDALPQELLALVLARLTQQERCAAWDERKHATLFREPRSALRRRLFCRFCCCLPGTHRC